MSLRAAAEQADVPFNTFSRVEKGLLPDLANYHRLTVWLGLDPGKFFPEPTRRREQDTTETIRGHLHSDPHLSEDAAEQIAALVANLYQNLAAPIADIEVHLRAPTTFAPEAARRLSDILDQMQDRLLADPALGAEPGWAS